MYPYRVFTLDKANIAVPEVARLTATVQERLDELRQDYDEDDPEAGQRLRNASTSCARTTTKTIRRRANASRTRPVRS